MKSLFLLAHRDWIQAAKARLAMEQTAKVIKTHIALLAESCS